MEERPESSKGERECPEAVEAGMRLSRLTLGVWMGLRRLWLSWLPSIAGSVKPNAARSAEKFSKAWKRLGVKWLGFAALTRLPWGEYGL